MPGPLFRVRLRLYADEGARRRPIVSDDRPSWNVGNTWLGKPTINDGRVFLEGQHELAPGAEALARIEPLAPELWGRVGPGSVITMQEGPRIVGHATVLEIIARPAYWSRETALFVDQARQFCAFVDQASTYSLTDRLVTARERLLELYQAGARLPDIEPPDGTAPRPSLEAPTGWPGFDNLDGYWEFFDPYEESQPVAASLSNDVLDIYGDLQGGLALWDKGGPTSNDDLRLSAIWQWRFYFEVHWGDHAIDALRALHRACKRT